MLSLLLQSLVLAIVVTTSYGCSCAFSYHPMVRYCPTDFVIRATVVSREGPFLPDGLLADIPIEDQYFYIDNYGVNFYKLEILEEIRVTKAYLNSSTTKDTMFVHEGSSLCGVSLDTSATYILSGHVVDSMRGSVLSTNACNFPEKIGVDEELPGGLKNLNCDGFSYDMFDPVVPYAREINYEAALEKMKSKKTKQAREGSPSFFDLIGKRAFN